MIWPRRGNRPEAGDRQAPDADWSLFEQRFLSDRLEILFQRHKDFVFRVAIAHCQNQADAEDVVQELFVQLAGGKLRAEPKAKFTTWLFGVVTNLARAHQRKRSRFESMAEPLEHLNSTSSAQAEAGAELNRLLGALAQLPARQREVFVARRLEQLDTNETAQALGMSSGTVKAHLSRATTALSCLLEPVSISTENDIKPRSGPRCSLRSSSFHASTKRQEN